VSIGRTVPGDTISGNKSASTDIVNTLDAVTGSSGSPVFDRAGHLLGMVRHGDCQGVEGELNIRIAKYCGVTLIVPIHQIVRFVDN